MVCVGVFLLSTGCAGNVLVDGDDDHAEDEGALQEEPPTSGETSGRDDQATCAELTATLTLRGCDTAGPFENICQHHTTAVAEDGCAEAFLDVAACMIEEGSGCDWDRSECAELDEVRLDTCFPGQY